MDNFEAVRLFIIRHNLIERMCKSRFFLYISGPALWNALPVPLRNAETILTLRILLNSHLFDLTFPP